MKRSCALPCPRSRRIVGPSPPSCSGAGVEACRVRGRAAWRGMARATTTPTTVSALRHGRALPITNRPRTAWRHRPVPGRAATASPSTSTTAWGTLMGPLRKPRSRRPPVAHRTGQGPSARPTRSPPPSTSGVSTAGPWPTRVVVPLVEASVGRPERPACRRRRPEDPRGIAHTMVLKAAAKVTKRAVAIGHCKRSSPERRRGHVTPRAGGACEGTAEASATPSALETLSRRDPSSRTSGCGRSAARPRGGRPTPHSTVSTSVLPCLVEGTERWTGSRASGSRPDGSSPTSASRGVACRPTW